MTASPGTPDARIRGRAHQIGQTWSPRQGLRRTSGVAARTGLKRTIATVKGTRTVKRHDVVHNEIDAQTCEARADGQLLTCEPATELPMAQKCFLF